MVRPLLLKIPTRRAIQQILCASGARDMNNPLTSFCSYSDRCIAARLRRNRVSGQRGGLKSTPKARNVKTTCVVNMISGCEEQRRVKSTVNELTSTLKELKSASKGVQVNPQDSPELLLQPFDSFKTAQVRTNPTVNSSACRYVQEITLPPS